jgi:hypothetical protein
MEIKTAFLNEYTNKIDEQLSQSNDQKIIIYFLIVFILLLIFGIFLALIMTKL